MKRNRNKEFYSTRVFILWVVAITVALVLVPFRKGLVPNWNYFCIGVLIIYISGYFTLRQLIFKCDKVEIRNVIYPFNKGVVREITYREIYAVEIRNISAPYQLPYIILHYSNKSINSNNFILRSGVFKKKDDMSEFIKKLQELNVRVIENY